MTERYADLHIHTVYSDGLWGVERVVEEALNRGISVISITDHDTVDGVEEALKVGEKYGVEVIPGVELSSFYKDYDVHILGYFIDWGDRNFRIKIDKVRKVREERAKIIISKLEKLGVRISYDRVKEIAGASPIGRPHIAQAMYEKGYVSSVEESFEKYIGDGGPAYHPKILYSPDEVIRIIKEYRGVPVLAHPGRLPWSIVEEIMDMGVEGMEVFYPEHERSLIDRLLRICDERGLLVTGGSDCHGGLKGRVYLGEIKLPYFYVERLKNHANANTVLRL